MISIFKGQGIIKLVGIPQFVNQVKELFDLELNGYEEIRLPDGRLQLEFAVSGWRQDMAKDMIRMLTSMPTDQVNVKFFGQDIHKN